MEFVADLHVHSRFSRATSQDATPENFYRWAAYKGVTLVGTGDFTHPAWREELQNKLEPAEEEGLYRLKEEFCRLAEEADRAGFPAPPPAPGQAGAAGFEAAGRPLVRFVVSGEISTIYKKGGRVRKVHHLILLPSLAAAEEICQRLERIGNLQSDGRPILGLDSRHLLELVLEACPTALFIPAHIWTPHFSLFGANSGFDAVEECFEDLTPYIHAVETGLSSDPPMNWRLSALDRFVLVSNSDAHSPKNLAREANLFNTELSYPALYRALKERDPAAFLGTLEFFPEEGKYHYDGHRACGLRWHPAETRAAGGICPVCGRKVTVGVLHRVEELADRPAGVKPAAARHFESLVPLAEVIADALGVGPASRQVDKLYFSLLRHLGPELAVLRQAPLEAVARLAGAQVAEAVRRMRAGEIEVQPGFDGEYGKIILLPAEERPRLAGQLALFAEAGAAPAATGKEKGGAEPPARPAPGDSGGGEEGGRQQGAGQGTVAAAQSCHQVGASAAQRGEPLLAGLNAEQLAAATAADGPVIVVAGPGTGKTRTLVYRIAHLIGERKVPPQHITAVTFTNKAAEEIRHRVAEVLGSTAGSEALTVGTFHSLCLELLRSAGAFGAQAAAPRPLTVLDEADARQVLAEVLAEMGRPAAREAPKLQRLLSLYKGRGLRPAAPEVPQDVRPVYQAYQERLAAYRALDYDDLLLAAEELLEGLLAAGDQAQAREILSRFTHLLVDEFQDVNAVQYRLVRLLSGDGKNLFVIGDPDQAIYGFRGADNRLFWRLKEDFPAARIFRLTINYRSTPAILKAAGAVMAAAPEGNGEAAPQRGARLVATRGEGPKIVHLEVPGELAEGIAVVREIGRLVGGATMLAAHGQAGGLPAAAADAAWGFADVAVLFRTGRQGEALEECFLKEGLPYRMVGKESFLEERPVREALAFLRCVVDPEDDFHLLRCLAAGPFGLGPAGLAALRRAAASLGSVAAAVAALATGRAEVSRKDRDRLAAFQEAVAAYRHLAATAVPSAVLARWAKEAGYGEEESLQRLARVAARFADLPSFLRGLVLAQEADCDRPGPNAAAEAVSLMTLHAAKGLEFPVVFITGVEDGLIPLKDPEANDADLAEERRLFYVGLTRARDLLVLVSARRRTLYGRPVAAQPSPFLADIPQDCLEKRKWSAGARKGAGRPADYQQLRLF